MMIPGVGEQNDLDKFVLKPSPNKFRTLSTRKTNVINDSSVTQSKTNHTEIVKYFFKLFYQKFTCCIGLK